MKIKKPYYNRNLIVTVWQIVIVTVLFAGFSGYKPAFIIKNPYDKVKWDEYGRFKTDLHAHTIQSECKFSPYVIIDCYIGLGYDILAIADRNIVTYPWQEFSSFITSDLTLKRYESRWFEDVPYEEIFGYEDRNSNAMITIDIQANEVSQHDHMLSYYIDHPGGNFLLSCTPDCPRQTAEEILDDIATKDELGILAHPGFYNGISERWPYHPIDCYVDLYQSYDYLTGQENHNLQHWDSILIRLMPIRQVRGFSNNNPLKSISNDDKKT